MEHGLHGGGGPEVYTVDAVTLRGGVAGLSTVRRGVERLWDCARAGRRQRRQIVGHGNTVAAERTKEMLPGTTHV